jgi:hypothetical protein
LVLGIGSCEDDEDRTAQYALSTATHEMTLAQFDLTYELTQSEFSPAPLSGTVRLFNDDRLSSIGIDAMLGDERIDVTLTNDAGVETLCVTRTAGVSPECRTRDVGRGLFDGERALDYVRVETAPNRVALGITGECYELTSDDPEWVWTECYADDGILLFADGIGPGFQLAWLELAARDLGLALPGDFKSAFVGSITLRASVEVD